MKMRNAIVVDINGTLSDVSKVVHFIKGADKDWVSFFGHMNDVPVNPMVRDFIKRFKPGHSIVLVSGAPDRYEPQTRSWLAQHSVPFDDLFFRPAWDKRRGWQFKKTLYETRLKNLYHVKLVLDDKADACDMWTKQKLECWKLPSDMDDAGRNLSTEPGKRFAHLVQTANRLRH
jgi:hypothetical protein